jgi:hypothetical protein
VNADLKLAITPKFHNVGALLWVIRTKVTELVKKQALLIEDTCDALVQNITDKRDFGAYRNLSFYPGTAPRAMA